MDRGIVSADDDEIALRGCPVLFAPATPFVGREADLEQLAARAGG